jgi:hypothetical protein
MKKVSVVYAARIVGRVKGESVSVHNSTPIKYRCTDDCQMSGCPGHELVLTHNITTDHYEVRVDGEIRETFDDDRFHAMLTAYASILTSGEQG